MKEIILATSNKGKIKELQALLSSKKCTPQTQLNIKNVKETGLTFIENAILKARHASILGEKPALADDSGLVVHALNGEPGIYSSRYAGQHGDDQDNIAKLLEKMKTVPDEQRAAYFYCAMALIQHPTDPAPILSVGRINGFITRQPAGEGGFGYDPVFYVPSQECTTAQLSLTIKNKISHRALALKALLKQIN